MACDAIWIGRMQHVPEIPRSSDSHETVLHVVQENMDYQLTNPRTLALPMLEAGLL